MSITLSNFILTVSEFQGVNPRIYLKNFDRGTAVLVLPDSMSAADVKDLADQFDIILRKLKRALP